MESFDEFFSSNRQQFNNCEPPLGHEQRFMARLQQRKRAHIFRIAISSAASVAIVVSFTALMAWYYHGTQMKRMVANLNNEASADVELYYNTLLEQKYREIEQVVTSQKPELSVEVTQIMRDFELENRSIRSELSNSQKKDYMVGVMVQSYQTQIDILDKIQATIEINDADM